MTYDVADSLRSRHNIEPGDIPLFKSILESIERDPPDDSLPSEQD